MIRCDFCAVGTILLTCASKLLTFLSTLAIIFLYSCSAAFLPSGAFFPAGFAPGVLGFFVTLGFLFELPSFSESGYRWEQWVGFADSFGTLRMSAGHGLSHAARRFCVDIGGLILIDLIRLKSKSKVSLRFEDRG
jgi:hypothetical protein